MNKFLFLFSVAVIFALINSNEASDVAEGKFLSQIIYKIKKKFLIFFIKQNNGHTQDTRTQVIQDGVAH